MLAVGLMLTAPAGFFLSTWLPYHANSDMGNRLCRGEDG